MVLGDTQRGLAPNLEVLVLTGDAKPCPQPAPGGRPSRGSEVWCRSVGASSSQPEWDGGTCWWWKTHRGRSREGRGRARPKEPPALEPGFSQCGCPMRGKGCHGRCGRDAGLPLGVHAGHKTPVRPHLCEPGVRAALREDSPCGLSSSVQATAGLLRHRAGLQCPGALHGRTDA